jgi:hypothetical protein
VRDFVKCTIAIYKGLWSPGEGCSFQEKLAKALPRAEAVEVTFPDHGESTAQTVVFLEYPFGAWDSEESVIDEITLKLLRCLGPQAVDQMEIETQFGQDLNNEDS